MGCLRDTSLRYEIYHSFSVYINFKGFAVNLTIISFSQLKVPCR